MNLLPAFVGIPLLALALLLVPLGLPGVWIMVALLGGGALLGEVGWVVVLTAAALAGLAEFAEYWLVARLNLRYGGGRGAFWGAVAGGLVGVVVGMPIPVVGPVVAGFLGTFVGAALVTLLGTRDAWSAGRVGWGVLLGRVLAAVVKVGTGVVILVMGATALLVR
ncbi:MAG: DUF456 family protein [Gemmatimonadota bacterium]